jgi:hypothetical protein
MSLFLIVFFSVLFINTSIVFLVKKYLSRDVIERIPFRLGFFLVAMMSSVSLIYSAMYIEYRVPQARTHFLDTLSRYEPLSTVVIPQREEVTVMRPEPKHVSHRSMNDLQLDLNKFNVTKEVKSDLTDFGDLFGDPTEEGVSGDWNKFITSSSVNADAAFPGGYDEFASFVRDNFRVKPRLNGQSKEVVIYVGFTIAADGAVENISVLRGQNEAIDREVLRVLNLSPSWSPAVQDGMNVEVVKRLPIRINVFD